jgi:hypothetical protein
VGTRRATHYACPTTHTHTHTLSLTWSPCPCAHATTHQTPQTPAPPARQRRSAASCTRAAPSARGAWRRLKSSADPIKSKRSSYLHPGKPLSRCHVPRTVALPIDSLQRGFLRAQVPFVCPHSFASTPASHCCTTSHLLGRRLLSPASLAFVDPRRVLTPPTLA